LKRLSLDFVKRKFSERGYELLEKEYKNVSTKMRFKCPQHPDLDTKITYHDFSQGAGCFYCGIESRTKANRTPLVDINNEFLKRGYLLLEAEYKNNRTPMRFICPKHVDKLTEISYGQLSRGHGCIYCAGKGKPLTIEVDKEFTNRGYTLLSPYKNSASKLEYICLKHPSKILNMTYNNFKNGQQCTYCAGISRYTIEDVREIFSEVGYVLLEEHYTDNSTPLKFKCPRHPEKDTVTTLKSLLKGTRCRYCYLESFRGENHPAYNHNLTDEEREYKRYYPDYYEWRRKVFERDKYSCVGCGDSKGGNLIAHHKDGYGWCKERRTDVDNGVTLCESCHKEFHSLYGFRNNTESQYTEWLKTKEASE
jgi:ribosomal protein S27AE